MGKEKENKQHIMIDISNIDDIKSEVNIQGLQNQLIMIDCLSQAIIQISQKSRNMSDLIIENIRNFKGDNGDAELLIEVMKQIVGKKD